jgi:hypothetical protein
MAFDVARLTGEKRIMSSKLVELTTPGASQES